MEKLKSEVELIVKEKNEAIIRQDFNRASELKEKEKELVDKVNKLEMKAFAKKIVKKVKIDDLIEVINMKTKIPVYELLKNDIERIKQVRNKFEDEIIGQDEVIDTLINKLKHIKFGFKEDNKPNSFIFAGATGVGKTKLATLFGESLVGIPNIIKLDMSEYAESYSTSKIIGAAPGYVGYMDNKNVLEEIRNKPHSVIIIDEIEKAHPNVIGLFLQILDEGKIKDAKGLIIRFDNTILIFTTNLGYSISSVGFNRSDNQIISILKENLGVEFINRLDNIILFNKLTEQDIEKIIKMKLQKLRAKVKKRGLTIRINNKVINNVKELSDYKNFGARRIDKIIKDKIESQIIDGIIDKKKIINIKLGDKEKIVN